SAPRRDLRGYGRSRPAAVPGRGRPGAAAGGVGVRMRHAYSFIGAYFMRGNTFCTSALVSPKRPCAREPYTLNMLLYSGTSPESSLSRPFQVPSSEPASFLPDRTVTTPPCPWSVPPLLEPTRRPNSLDTMIVTSAACGPRSVKKAAIALASSP